MRFEMRQLLHNIQVQLWVGTVGEAGSIGFPSIFLSKSRTSHLACVLQTYNKAKTYYFARERTDKASTVITKETKSTKIATNFFDMTNVTKKILIVE